MSKALPHAIGPVLIDRFTFGYTPLLLSLRLGIALLVLAWGWWTPGEFLLTTWAWMQISLVVYAFLQILLALPGLMDRPGPISVYLATVLDVVATLAVVVNDPQPIPVTLLLFPVTLIIPATLLSVQAFVGFLTTSLLSAVLALALRQTTLQQLPDFAFWTLASLTTLTALACLLLNLLVEVLRQRAARVTEADARTGMDNRWTFYEAAKYLLPYHQRNLTPMMVLFAEIEFAGNAGRKLSYNQRQQATKQFALISEQRVRACDIAVQYSENEFAYLLLDTQTRQAEELAAALQQTFNSWARSHDTPAYCHVGLSVVPVRPVALDQILININAALHRAKQYRKGVSGAVFADPEQR